MYQYIKKFDKFYSEKCSLYSLTDLSFEKTVNSISKIKSKKYLIIDDSPYKFGVVSQIELILRKSNPNDIIIEHVAREDNFIPFAKKFEDRTRPTEKRLKIKFCIWQKLIYENNFQGYF